MVESFLDVDIVHNEKIAVLSTHPGSLLSFTGLLNDLGYYSISLCSSTAQLIALLEMGKSFCHLIVDAFEMEVNAHSLEEVAWFQAISSFTLIADVNSAQRQDIFQWAEEQGVPLRGVLQAPLRVMEFRSLMGAAEHSGAMPWYWARRCCRVVGA
jgi:hypothetical protein